MFRKADEILGCVFDVERPVNPFDTEILEEVRVHCARKEIRGDVILCEKVVREVEHSLRREVE